MSLMGLPNLLFMHLVLIMAIVAMVAAILMDLALYRNAGVCKRLSKKQNKNKAFTSDWNIDVKAELET